jgi:DNA excision repair protein ERCC-3
MGRILRAKRRHEEGFKSRFYTLVASDTDEVSFSSKRRSFLVDQGYEFNVIPNFNTWATNTDKLMYSTPAEQDIMLALIKTQDEAAGDDEVVEADADDLAGVWQAAQIQKQKALALKKSGKVAAKAPSAKPPAKKQHSLFRQFRK